MLKEAAAFFCYLLWDFHSLCSIRYTRNWHCLLKGRVQACCALGLRAARQGRFDEKCIAEGDGEAQAAFPWSLHLCRAKPQPKHPQWFQIFSQDVATWGGNGLQCHQSSPGLVWVPTRRSIESPRPFLLHGYWFCSITNISVGGVRHVPLCLTSPEKTVCCKCRRNDRRPVGVMQVSLVGVKC